MPPIATLLWPLLTRLAKEQVLLKWRFCVPKIIEIGPDLLRLFDLIMCPFFKHLVTMCVRHLTAWSYVVLRSMVEWKPRTAVVL